jgi:hypothetical protein
MLPTTTRAEANDDILPVTVEDGSRGCLKISADGVNQNNVAEDVTYDLYFILVAKSSLPNVSYPEASCLTRAALC